jgi:hypothetical protein
MEKTATGNAAVNHAGDGAALDALRWNWGDAYDIGHDGNRWWFTRRDGTGGTETASGPDALRTAIIDNYTLRPVCRDTALEVEDRRDRYEAAGVRIWHDPGGWHARWPVGGTHTGISHPDHLTGLLDRLDALKDSPSGKQ